MAVSVEIEPALIADATAGMMDQVGPSLQRCRRHGCCLPPAQSTGYRVASATRTAAVRYAAPELHGWPCAVLQWTEPRAIAARLCNRRGAADYSVHHGDGECSPVDLQQT